MNFKDVKFGDDARIKMIQGVNILGNAVRATLGPKGRNVVIKRKFTGPHVTKDGVSVAKEIHLRDEFQDMGAQLVLEASVQTNANAGDGPQPLTAKVLTPDGFTTMGELKVGQLICGTNGSYQTVEEIFEKGIREVYQVTFSDNQVVECCLDHYWTVVDNRGRPKTTTVQLKDMLSTFKQVKNGSNFYSYYVQRTIPELKDKELTIHPFLLGVLIGDGYLTGETIEISLGLSKEWVINSLLLPAGIEKKVKWNDKKNYFRVKLQGKTPDGKTMVDLVKELGLNVKSADKFIPKNYLYGSIETRSYLVEGLAATDGYYNKRYNLEYSTISKQLAEDFHSLMLSLGRSTKIEYRERTGDSYSDNPIYRMYEREGYQHGIKIVDIRSTGRFEDMRCIRVSNDDHLYITDDFIVTHNTTTSTVLAQAIINEGIRYIDKGVGSVDIKRGIDLATQHIVELIKEKSIPVAGQSDLIKIARISANNDPVIAGLITDALEAVGSDGVINVERGAYKDELEIVSGMRIDSGWVNSHFLTQQDKMVAELDKPYIVLIDKELDNVNDILRLLQFINEDKRSAVIVAHKFSEEVLGMLAINVKQGNLKVCPVVASGYGERRTAILEDVATYTGGSVFNSNNGLDIAQVSLRQIGHCDKAVISSEETAIIGKYGKDEDINDRITRIRNEIETETTKYTLDRLKERLGTLTKGVAIIRVGGHTEAEMKEKKDRVDDAVCAVRASLEEGYLPGGGVALLRLAETLDDFPVENEDQGIGVRILQRAMKAPFHQIVANAGKNPEVVEHKVFFFIGENNFNTGYDAARDSIEDMVSKGIVDPAKVTRVALQNAASIAGIFLTTEVAIGWDGDDMTDNLGFLGN